MSVIRSVLLAFSMFSRLPVPRCNWEKANMRWLLAAFPLVGSVIGLLLRGWFWLSTLLGFGTALFAAGVALLPAAVSGGIHLDGLCDVSDALASRADRETKRRILKDPHTGAFAVISVCGYLLLYFALVCELPRTAESAWTLAVIHTVSRAASGLCSLLLPGVGEGSLSTLRAGAAGKGAVVVLALTLCGCAAAFLLLSPLCGTAALSALALCVLLLRHTAKAQFGGMSGDLAGWFLCIVELAMLAAVILTEKAVAL